MASDDRANRQFLVELKSLSHDERKVALRISKELGTGVARKYVRVVIENKAEMLITQRKSSRPRRGVKEVDYQSRRANKAEVVSESDAIVESFFLSRPQKMIKKVFGRNYAKPIDITKAAENLEYALGQYAISYADQDIESTSTPTQVVTKTKNGLAKALRMSTAYARHVASALESRVPPTGIKSEARTRLENNIRMTIREVLALEEQVVGYTPPKEKGSDGGGYLSVGDMGVDTDLDSDSTDEKQASADQVKKLTQQRQQDLDQGDTVGANNIGQQLGMARKMRG